MAENTFSCSICKYSTRFNGNLQKHLKSKKHLNYSEITDIRVVLFECNKCDKKYKAKSGLWKHNKICKITESKHKDVQNINTNQEIIEAMSIMNDHIKISNEQMKQTNEQMKQTNEQINRRMDKLSSDLKENQQIVQTINNNNNTTINNTFNMSIFLNEKCNEAINFEEFIKRIMFEYANSTLMMESYVEGTSNIIQRNLEQIPVNKRPMHCLVGEDPHQQLVHIRQDDKWNTSSELNWMQQIHADDDDNVVDKNPIYYALQKIDDKKLEYLAYNLYSNDLYIKHYSRLRSELGRQDFKEKVYRNILKMVSLDTGNLDEIHKISKIII
jgi:predicted RND superfamily exporter protein